MMKNNPNNVLFDKLSQILQHNSEFLLYQEAEFSSANKTPEMFSIPIGVS